MFLTTNESFTLLETYDPKELGKKYARVEDIGKAYKKAYDTTHINPYITKAKIKQAERIKKRIKARALNGGAGVKKPRAGMTTLQRLKSYIPFKHPKTIRAVYTKGGRETLRTEANPSKFAKAYKKYKGHLYGGDKIMRNVRRKEEVLKKAKYHRNVRNVKRAAVGIGLYAGIKNHFSKKARAAAEAEIARRRKVKIGAGVGAGLLGAAGLYGMYKNAQEKRRREEENMQESWKDVKRFAKGAYEGAKSDAVTYGKNGAIQGAILGGLMNKFMGGSAIKGAAVNAVYGGAKGAKAGMALGGITGGVTAVHRGRIFDRKVKNLKKYAKIGAGVAAGLMATHGLHKYVQHKQKA